MTKQVLTVSVGELTTIRMTCKCGTVVEFKLDTVTERVSESTCPVCRKAFRHGYKEVDPDPIFTLAAALKELKSMDGEHFTSDFPVG